MPVNPPMDRSFGYPPSTAPEDVPAFADENDATRTVTLSHPFGREHPSLEAAVARYKARGWQVVVQLRRAAQKVA